MKNLIIIILIIANFNSCENPSTTTMRRKMLELEYLEKLYSVRDDIDLKIEERRVDSLIVSFERYLNNREKRKNGQN